jgi:hypothetical protein
MWHLVVWETVTNILGELAACSPEISVTIYLSARCHIPEDSNDQIDVDGQCNMKVSLKP